MKKFKLDLDDLRVQSFTALSDGQKGARGTVRGYAYPTEVSCNTCEDTSPEICTTAGLATCSDTCGTTSCPSLNCDCATQACQTDPPYCENHTGIHVTCNNPEMCGEFQF